MAGLYLMKYSNIEACTNHNVPPNSAEEFERLYTGKRAELRRGQVGEYMPAGGK